jgi:uncharacterized membrane protein
MKAKEKKKLRKKRKARLEKDKCGFCGGDGYITVAGSHDITCKECRK